MEHINEKLNPNVKNASKELRAQIIEACADDKLREIEDDFLSVARNSGQTWIREELTDSEEINAIILQRIRERGLKVTTVQVTITI